MIKIKNAVWPSSEQWMAVIHGMRNPMNSWDKSDGYVDAVCWPTDQFSGVLRNLKMRVYQEGFSYLLGKNDIKLAKNLINSGVEHAKFLRQLPVILDIKAPLYWWKQMDTYSVGTTTDSCSTMHKLTEKPFSIDDFSLGELSDENYYIESGQVGVDTNKYVRSIVPELNVLRDKYIETNDKKYWNAINRLLPQSYNQLRTWSANYAVLFNICAQRAGHKLNDEWDPFIRYNVVNAPYFKELCFDKLCKVSKAFKEMYERVA